MVGNLPDIKPKTAFLLSDIYMRKYFTGLDNDEGYVVLTENEITYLTDARYYSALKEKAAGGKVNVLLYKGTVSLKRLLKSRHVTKLYVEFGVTTLSEYNALKKLNVGIYDGGAKLSDCRAVKNAEELENIQKAATIALNALDNALKNIKTGVTELFIKKRLEEEMVRLGAQEKSFDTIVAFGKNSAVPHHVSDDTPLKENSVVLIDFGCKVNGYCSDITRTLFYGEPDKEFLSVFNTVANAQKLAKDKIVAGMGAKDADGIARNYFAERGVDKLFTHSLGHGLGLQIHEQPYLSPRGKSVLKDGVAFTIEPGLYIDGKYGVRLEDTCVLADGKVRSLTGDACVLKTLSVK